MVQIELICAIICELNSTVLNEYYKRLYLCANTIIAPCTLFFWAIRYNLRGQIRTNIYE